MNPREAQRSLTVVVPMLDAGVKVDAVHDVLSELVADAHPDAEMILVDDASTDDTWEHIVQLTRRDARVLGIRLRTNVGQTGALCAGFSLAGGRVVVIMDDDLECGPADLERLVAAVDAGADFASGWRRGWRTPLRLVGSRLYNARLRNWGLPFHDAGCGANAMTLDLARRIADLGWGVRQHRFKPAVATLTDRIVEVPFEVRPTKESHHGIRSLALSWLDVEVHFGSLTPARIAAVTVGLPAVVALGAASRLTRRASLPTRSLLALCFVGFGCISIVSADVLRRWANLERRDRSDPPFVIAERMSTAAHRSNPPPSLSAKAASPDVP